jgi:hypothetical protein
LKPKKCPICKRNFKPKKGTQIYCSRACALKDIPRIRKLKESNVVKCKYCGKKFKRKRRSQIFCSRDCAFKGRWKENACIHCGSTEMFNRRICRKCYLKIKKEKSLFTLICKKCGKEQLSRSNIRKKDRPNWLCADCRPKRLSPDKPVDPSLFKLCPVCRRAFYHKKNKCCSLDCAVILKRQRVIYEKCSDCGSPLNEKNKTHKSTSRVCDYCMWKRKRKYKAREKYGEFYRVVLKIKDTNLLTKVGLEKAGTITISERYKKLWKRRVRELASER